MLGAIRGSIRLKMVVVMMTTAVAALVIAAVVLVIYDARRYEAGSANDLRTQADIVGRASAAALDPLDPDPAAARQTLAFLDSRPRISAAVLYDRSGRPFAWYRRGGGDDLLAPARPGPDGYRIEGAHMTYFQRLDGRGGRLGTIFLRADYELGVRVTAYLAIVAGAMVGSVLVAFLLSLWLQRAVTEPILRIAEVARQVKERRDLSLRALRTTEDELGELADTFNGMIDEIHRRTEALERANATLEREMEVRRDAERALREADRRKDEFLATLAHELRNPLAPMNNALHVLSAHPGDPEAGRKAREILDRQLAHLVRLVDDLLDVSRITTGKLALRRTATDLHGLVQVAVDAVAPFLAERKHQLDVRMPVRPETVHVDAMRLGQVVLNLLHNAAKFTEPGGRIALRAELEGRELRIEVSDSGIGIPREKLPFIFEMFEQLDRRLERPHSGLGVGLSLARRLVELHGGTLTADSAGENRGARFRICIPEAASLPAAGAGPHRPGGEERRGAASVVDSSRGILRGEGTGDASGV